MLLLLIGCFFITKDEHVARLASFGGGDDTGAVDTSPEGELALDAVDPPWGPTSGNVDVTLTGGPFDEGVQVWFGDDAASVLSVTSDTVVVRPPAVTSPGPVAVTAEAEAGRTSLADGFTYWVDGEGKTGAIGELAWFSLQGDYWSGSEDDYGRGNLVFVEPDSAWEFYRYWAEEPDTCTHFAGDEEPTLYSTSYERINAGSGTATISEPTGGEVGLRWVPPNEDYEADDVPAADMVGGADYDLSLRGASDLPAFDLQDFVSLPRPFTLDTPEIDGHLPPVVSSTVVFEWSGGEPADFVIIQFGFFNASQSAFQEQAWCIARDDGSFTIPASTWTTWAPDRLSNILVGRYRKSSAILPFNLAAVDMVGEYYLYGAANTQ